MADNPQLQTVSLSDVLTWTVGATLSNGTISKRLYYKVTRSGTVDTIKAALVFWRNNAYNSVSGSEYSSDSATITINNQTLEVADGVYVRGTSSSHDEPNVDIATVLNPNGHTYVTGNAVVYTYDHTNAANINISAAWSFTVSPFSSGSLSTTVSLSATYSACGAPGSVTIPSRISKNSNAVTVTWTAGSAGINNSINGYTIEVTVGSTTKTAVSSSSSRSVTVTGFSFAAGSTATAKVKTVSSINSTFDSDWTNSNSGIINTPPSLTNTTQVTSTIKSTSSGYSASISSSGVSDSNNDTVQIRWYNSNNTLLATTALGAAYTINPSAGTTLTIKAIAYDGYDESANNKPYVITKISAPTTPTISVEPSGETATGWSNAPGTMTNVSTGASSYTWQIGYAFSGDNWLYSDIYTTQGPTITQNITTTISNNTVRNDDLSFRLRARYGITTNEGTQYSSWGYTTIRTITGTLTVSHYNQHSNSNVQDSNPNDFYNKIRFKITDGLTGGFGSPTVTAAISAITMTQSATGNDTIDVTITNPNNLAPATEYTFIVSVVSGNWTKNTQIKLRQTPDPLGSISTSQVAIRPFTNIFPFDFSITMGYSDVSDIHSTVSAANFSAVIVGANNTASLTINSVTTIGTNTWNLSLRVLSAAALDSLGANQNASNSYPIRISYTNVLGRQFSVSSNSIVTLDYREAPIYVENFGITLSDNAINSSTGWPFWIYGRSIKLQMKYKLFNTVDRSLSLYYGFSNTTTNAPSSYSLLATLTTDNIPLSTGESTTTFWANGSLIVPQVPVAGKYVWVKVTFSNSFGSIVTSNAITPPWSTNGICINALTQQQYDPVLSLVNVTPNGTVLFNSIDGNLGITALQNNTNVTFNCSFEYSANSDFTDSTTLSILTLTDVTLITAIASLYSRASTTGESVTGFNPQDPWESFYGRINVSIKIKNTTSPGYTSPLLEFSSNTILFYNVIPTVAYRKNKLGINTETISTNDIVVINALTNEKMIHLHSTAKNLDATILIPTAIDDPSAILLSGFTIDGGTWSSS